MSEYGDIAKALKALKVSVDANTKATIANTKATIANTKALNIPGAVVDSDAAVGDVPVRLVEDHPVYGGAIAGSLYGSDTIPAKFEDGYLVPSPPPASPRSRWRMARRCPLN